MWSFLLQAVLSNGKAFCFGYCALAIIREKLVEGRTSISSISSQNEIRRMIIIHNGRLAQGRRWWRLIGSIGIVLVLSQCSESMPTWRRKKGVENRRSPPPQPQLPPFMAPMTDAWRTLQQEAVAKIDDGKRNLESATKAYEAMARQRVMQVDGMIDEMDSCLDNLAVNIDRGWQKVKENLAESRAAVTEKIETHLGIVRNAFAEMTGPLGWWESNMEDGGEEAEGRIGVGGGLFGRGGVGGKRGIRKRGRFSQDRDRIDSLNDRTLRSVLRFADERDGWEHVTTSENVTVYRKYLDFSGVEGGGEGVMIDDKGNVCEGDREERGGHPKQRFACVKAVGIVDAPVHKVFELFMDNNRVHEYNEHCREIADIDTLTDDTKVTWSASGRYGPFKARDFCTIVHYRKLKDGSLVVINRSADHVKAPRSDKYVRSEILLAGNVMRPHPTDPSKTMLITLTHVNPGGCVDSKAGAMMVNMITATSPVQFIRKIETAARKGLSQPGFGGGAGERRRGAGARGEDPSDALNKDYGLDHWDRLTTVV